jgi:hypothetical protein
MFFTYETLLDSEVFVAFEVYAVASAVSPFDWKFLWAMPLISKMAVLPW